MKERDKRFWIQLAVLIALSTAGTMIMAKEPLTSPTSPTVIIPVLTYHRIIPKPTSIYDFTPQMLKRHLKFYKSLGYQPITAAQLIAFQKQPALFPKKPLVLTFDDGNKSHYTWVFPLLKKYHFPATFFIYPDVIRGCSPNCLTWTELKEMADAGFDIECHSMTHPFLSRSQIPQGDDTPYLKWLNHELFDSKTLIENKLGRKVTLLAYPYGWFDQSVENAAIQAGYQGIFTVNWGQNLATDNPLRLKRRVMENTMSLADIKENLKTIPLEIQVISPVDAGIVSKLPLIQFKINNPAIQSLNIKVRNYYEANLVPDSSGVYTFNFAKLAKLNPGYSMIIVRGYDSQKRFYLGSWGFNYQVPAKDSPETGQKDQPQKVLPSRIPD